MSKFYFSNVIVFIISYFEPNFIKKFLWESGFFQIFAEIEMTQNENRLFGHHFETVKIFNIFFAGIWLYLVYTYMV